jgi:hypothetical protein
VAAEAAAVSASSALPGAAVWDPILAPTSVFDQLFRANAPACGAVQATDRLSVDDLAATQGYLERPSVVLQLDAGLKTQLLENINLLGSILSSDVNADNRFTRFVRLGFGMCLLPFLTKRLEGPPLAFTCQSVSTSLRKAPASNWSRAPFANRLRVFATQDIASPFGLALCDDPVTLEEVLLVADYNLGYVHVLVASTGKPVRLLGASGVLSSPTDVKTDVQDGITIVAVSDQGRHAIVLFDLRDGQMMREIGNNLPLPMFPSSVAFTAQHTLVVPDRDHHRVLKFAMDGTLLATWNHGFLLSFFCSLFKCVCLCNGEIELR